MWKLVGDLVAPARCIECLREGGWLCRECIASTKMPPLVCVRCKNLSPRGLVCRECKKYLVLAGAVSVGSYESEYLRRGIHWLKFKGVKPVAPTLASLVIDQLSVISPVAQLQAEAVLVPVPLHKRRQRERGFNQAALIAKAMSLQTMIPYLELLARPKFTWTQTKLTADMRCSNLVGAFGLAEKLPEKTHTVLIVDDVTTTGSTLNEAAVVVKDAYPEVKFWGVTIARG